MRAWAGALLQVWLKAPQCLMTWVCPGLLTIMPGQRGASQAYLASFCAAVVRNEIDTYSTKFDACVNIVSKGGLIPIEFAEHYVDEKLMSPKKGAPVLVHLNRFSGWSAKLTISYIEGGAYSLEQIVNIINLAGFGIGIGSGRSSGYGRYHVQSIE